MLCNDHYLNTETEYKHIFFLIGLNKHIFQRASAVYYDHESHKSHKYIYVPVFTIVVMSH